MTVRRKFWPSIAFFLSNTLILWKFHIFIQYIDHIYPLLPHTNSPCALYPNTFPASCPILFLIFVISSSLSPRGTVHMYVDVRDHSLQHEQPTSSHMPRGECLPSLSCQCLFQSEWGLWEPIPNHSGILASLISCSNHSCYGLMRVTDTSYPEASISHTLPHCQASHSAYSLFDNVLCVLDGKMLIRISQLSIKMFILCPLTG